MGHKAIRYLWKQIRIRKQEQTNSLLYFLTPWESYLLTWRDRWVYKIKQCCYCRFYSCSTALSNLHYSKDSHYFRHKYTHDIFCSKPTTSFCIKKQWCNEHQSRLFLVLRINGNSKQTSGILFWEMEKFGVICFC